MNQAFIAHIQENNVAGSKKANSYIRALELLANILRNPNPLFSDGIDFWALATPSAIRAIYEYALQNQHDPNGIFLARHIPQSYGRNGYYSAALNAYAEFLANSPSSSKNADHRSYPAIPQVWQTAIAELEKSSNRDKPHYKPLALVAMLRRATGTRDGRVNFLEYESEWDALEAAIGESPSGKAYMPFFHVAAGQGIWSLYKSGKLQPVDRESRPKSRARYEKEDFYAVLAPEFGSLLKSRPQLAEVERRALIAARGVAGHDAASSSPLKTHSSRAAATADPLALDQSVRELLRGGEVPIPAGNPHPAKTTQNSTAYYREPEVVAYVLQEARGRCELCDQVPFHKPDGSVYLEVHHVRRLADGGADLVTNAVALCPNCHRKCHFSADKADQIEKLKQKVARLAE